MTGPVERKFVCPAGGSLAYEKDGLFLNGMLSVWRIGELNTGCMDR